MSIIAILTEDEKLAYDYPPILTVEARALCFVITPELEMKLNRLRTSTNKVGFLLQYGYFKVCKRFFIIDRFRQEDIDYAAKLLGISANDINLSQYKKKMPIVHQDAILKMLEYKSLDDTSIPGLEDELQRHINRFVEPRKLFFTALQLLHDRKIALPSYHLLFELISKHYFTYEENLLAIIKSHLTAEQKEKLNALLEINDKGNQGKLKQFKTINQSLKPKAIQASVEVFQQIADLFSLISPLIQTLALTPESCDYYATWVKKAKLSQLKQFPNQNRLFLHLIGFCQQQLKKLLAEKYDFVNQRFENQLNLYLSFNKEGKFHIATPALDDKQTEHIATLLDQSGQVPILKILNTVNQFTQFTKCFTHHNIKNAKRYTRSSSFSAQL